MWKRTEIKRRGKMAFKSRYWMCVLVSFILALASGAISTVQVNININDVDGFQADPNAVISGVTGFIGNLFSGLPVGYINYMMVGTGIVSSFVILVKLLVLNVLPVGGCRYFIENRYGNGELGQLLFPFRNNYTNVVLTMLLRDIFTILWSLLFIIPGIIKSYEYCMIPYILADHPETDHKEAFRISKEMMRGQKLDVFVLDLSFIGWQILGALTWGIVNYLYTAPYVNATKAELYDALKKNF